ncbi:Vitamin K-dependent protein C (Fragment) [Seminavis robusta]|uniref:Vitamin K-dependent protein C n=1 Tax=Seminavis robusta TaxID=568900 RepID=A0A9N8EW19_9STRA
MRVASKSWLLLTLAFAWVAAGETNGNLRRESEQEEPPASRIVGGSVASASNYPSHVQWALGCGGSLFHDDLVLTAAHCFFNNKNVLKNYPLYVGGDGSSQSGTELYAEAGYIHPLYDPSKAQAYDFAVLQLPQKITGIELMSINSDRHYPVNGQPLTVMGFGLMDEHDGARDAPGAMREVTIPMIDNCLPYYSSNRINDEIVFCAGDMPRGGKDACRGDSGGPIVDADGKQVGLVSWGIGCARANRPGVYARVSTIAKWLEYLKCDVSMYPPESCTRLDVNMTYDDYPEETGFQIIDDSDPEQQQAVIFEVPGKMDIPPRATIHYSYQLPIGNYSFVYEDANLDGSCCSFGDGHAVITNGGKGVNVSGDFSLYGSQQEESIEMPLPNVGVPGTNNSGWGELGGSTATALGQQQQQGNQQHVFGIQVVIMYDLDRVNDITWQLFTVDNSAGAGELVLLHNDAPSPNRGLDSYNRQSCVFQDLPAGSYEFHIEDASGMGFAPGVGFARVMLLDNTRGVLSGRLFHVAGDDIEPLTVATFDLGGDSGTN